MGKNTFVQNHFDGIIHHNNGSLLLILKLQGFFYNALNVINI